MNLLSQSLHSARHVGRVLRRAVRSRTIPAIPGALERLQGSDTLFVLGSGNSITQIRQWDQVRQNDSLGFNFWLLHDFVPDFYFTEAPRNPLDRECMLRNLRRVGNRYSDVTFFNKVREGSDAVGLTLSECGFVYHSMIPATFEAGSVDGLRESARTYRRSKLLRRLVFYCQGVATVDLAVLFGWAVGYERIILCGVDLTDSKYFFEDPQYEGLAKRGFLPSHYSGGRVHKTIDPSRAWGGIGISDVLQVYQEEVLGKKCQIHVENNSSALAGLFPVHPLR